MLKSLSTIKRKATTEIKLHSDQGSQYTLQAYLKLTQSYGVTPFISRQGNSFVV